MMTREATTMVTLLNWTFHVQKAHTDRGEMWIGFPANSSAVGIERNGIICGPRQREGQVIGCMVDMHPDAVTVHEAVLRLPGDDRAVVMRHARAGTPPDWMPGARPRFEPARWKKGANGERVGDVLYEPSAGIGHRPWLCPIRECDSPELIDAHRRIYARWYAALDGLAGRLELQRWRVIGVGAPVAPWQGEIAA